MLSYNSLPSVETADAARRAHPSFDSFLRGFATLVRDSGLTGSVGACLLHRHFALAEPTDAVLERPGAFDGAPALISRVVERLPSSAAPSSWCNTGSFEPLEFSEDPAVLRARPLQRPFLRAFARHLERHRLQHMIGLTLVQRDHIALADGQIYVEETIGSESVVRVTDAGEQGEDLITTVWAPSDVMGCAPTTHCRGWSTCRRDSDDRHSYAYGHDQEREHDRT
jgi:hypothetical protein